MNLFDTHISEVDGIYRCDLSVREEAIKELAETIEDELFAKIAEKKGYAKERTCKMMRSKVGEVTSLVCCECGCGTFKEYEESCDEGAWFSYREPNFCPSCGAKVVVE